MLHIQVGREETYIIMKYKEIKFYGNKMVFHAEWEGPKLRQRGLDKSASMSEQGMTSHIPKDKSLTSG